MTRIAEQDQQAFKRSVMATRLGMWAKKWQLKKL